MAYENAICNFCDKTRDQVSLMIAADKPNGTIYLCDECVELCVGIIFKRKREGDVQSIKSEVKP